MEVPAADKPGYQKLMREARINLTAKGIYDKRMMKLLWQFRCREDAKNFGVRYKMKTINNPVKVFKHTLNFKYRPDIEYAILNIGSLFLKTY